MPALQCAGLAQVQQRLVEIRCISVLLVQGDASGEIRACAIQFTLHGGHDTAVIQTIRKARQILNVLKNQLGAFQAAIRDGHPSAVLIRRCQPLKNKGHGDAVASGLGAVQICDECIEFNGLGTEGRCQQKQRWEEQEHGGAFHGIPGCMNNQTRMSDNDSDREKYTVQEV
jgi:hypothetical protein